MPPSQQQNPRPSQEESDKTDKPKQGSRISSAEWWLAVGFFAFIDLVQIVMDVLAVGEVLNRFDFLVGGAMALYLFIREYKFDSNDWIWVLATVLAEEIPVVDAAPLWCLDMWRFRGKDLARQKADKANAASS